MSLERFLVVCDFWLFGFWLFGEVFLLVNSFFLCFLDVFLWKFPLGEVQNWFVVVFGVSLGRFERLFVWGVFVLFLCFFFNVFVGGFGELNREFFRFFLFVDIVSQF